MEWFTGSIPEAITKAKAQNTLFVVFIYDSSEASQSIFTSLEAEEVSKIFCSQKFVAIKLENGKPNAQQFAAIYPLIVVPSLFFINSESGLPLEVVAGSVTTQELLERMAKVPLKSEVTETPAVSQAPPAREMNNPGPSTSMNNNDGPSIHSDDDEATCSSFTKNNDTQSVHENVEAKQNSEVLLEEKIDCAKELLVEKQRLKEMEQQEAEKLREVQRRKVGQDVLKAKDKRDKDQAITAANNYRKQKKEDVLAREEIKRRIQADREEREARAAIFSGQPSTAPPQSNKKQAVGPSTSDSKVARIKFRLPDGSSLLNQFPDASSLQDVHEYITSNCSLSTFNMTSTIHQRPFSAQDMSSSLRELGLVPSAIIIISPMARPEGTISTSSGGFLSFVWFVLTPFSLLFGFVQRLIGYGTPPEQVQTSEQDNSQSEPRAGSSTTYNRPKTAHGNKGRTGSSSRQEGNIRRFQNRDDEDDDDEEKKTWNGNSTQQM